MSEVHPSAFIGPGVELGTGVTVGPHAVLTGPCTIGDDVYIGPLASIGSPAEIRGGPHPPATVGGGRGVVIGDRVVIRDHVVVNQGSEVATTIGADSYVMHGSHIPHDAVLGRRATVSPEVVIGGHCWFGDGVTLGMGAIFHQFSVVGAHAMVGMGSVVTRPVPPFAMAYGVPSRVAGANRVGLARLGLDEATIERWHELLAAGEVAGHDGPAELADHVVAYRAQLPPPRG